MRQAGYLFLMLIFLGACSGKQKVPKNILQPEEMKQVLWDVFLAEALANQLASTDSSIVANDKIKEFTRNTFEVHKIDEQQFLKSYNWYVSHPETFSSILDSLQRSKSEAMNRPIIPEIPIEGIHDGIRLRKSLWITRDQLKAFH